MNQLVCGTVVVALALALQFLGWRLYLKYHSGGWWNGLAAAGLPTAALLTLTDIATDVLSAPGFSWNSVRLAAAFVITKGCDLYSGPDAGAVLGNIYGPVQAFSYLPATFFRTPVSALIAGACLSVCLFFLPVLWLHFRQHRGRPEEMMPAAYGFLVFCLVSFTSPALISAAFQIQADAPALGFGALACGCLFDKTRRQSPLRLVASSFFVALSLWSKQTMFPLALAVPTFLWLTEGGRCCGRYVLYLGASLVALLAIFTSLFNPVNLFFNMFLLPARDPWVGGFFKAGQLQIAGVEWPRRLRVLAEAGVLLFRACFPSLLILAAGFIITRHVLVKKTSNIRAWLAQHPWTMFAIAGLFLILTSLLGRVKVGGEINTFSPAVYFLTIAAALMFSQAMCALPVPKPGSISPPVRIIGAGLIGLFAIFGAYFSVNQFRASNDNSYAALQSGFGNARRHPGEIFFPWNPLITLMAEGKLHHFAWGVYNREIAGLPMSAEHFRAHLPPRMNQIAFELGHARMTIPQYLPEYSKVTLPAEMPGWVVYTKK